MIDVSALEDFAKRCEACKADLKPFAAKTLEEIGEEFLDIVLEEIVRHGHVVTGDLYQSFIRGRNGNIFQLDAGVLTLTVGSNLHYAQFVNKGHPQQPGRFVPGVWDGKVFRYIPGAKTGMMLKANKVKGSEFFEKAKETLEKMLPKMSDNAFEQFFKRYFP